MQKCIVCGIYPIVLPTGGTLCPKCKIQAPSEPAWDAVMASDKRKPTPLGQLIASLEDPLITLNAIAAHSDDPGIRRMATASLNRINKLNVDDFFTDAELARKVTERLLQLLNVTGTKQ